MKKDTTLNQLQQMVTDVANTLDAIADGVAYLDEDGNVFTCRETTDGYIWDFGGANVYERDHAPKDAEQMDISDYIVDALDIEVTHNLNGTYCGASVTLAYGGPSIYLNTRYGRVEGYWGADEVFVPISDAANNEVDEYIEEVASYMFRGER